VFAGNGLRRGVSTVSFQVLTATSMKMTVFCDVAPRSVVKIDGRFRDTYCLHHQGDRPVYFLRIVKRI
jgi:hypothetical protein